MDANEKLLADCIKMLLLANMALQEDFSAVTMCLRKRGLITQTEFNAAQAEMREHNRVRREQVEKFGVVDPAEILRGFDGPIQ